MNKRYLGRIHRNLASAQKTVSQEQTPVRVSVPHNTMSNIRNVVNNFFKKKD